MNLHPRHRFARTRGFTLIELLVVIAIIAILAAILFPVFARARENARRTSCLSNVKQFSLGLLQYTQDYDEAYPRSWYDAPDAAPDPPGGDWLRSGSVDRWYWQQMTYPYTKSTQIYTCPSQGEGRFNDRPYIVHYGANEAVLPVASPTSTTAPTRGLSMAAIQAPASVYLLMDGGNFSLSKYGAARAGNYASFDYVPGSGEAGAQCSAAGSSGVPMAGDCQTGRHFGGVNVGFADGHAKWLKTDKVRQQALSASTTNSWNPQTPS